MIKSLLLHPLGPSLVLALGGLLLLPLRQRGRPAPEARSPERWVLPLAFVFLLAAGVLLWLLRGAGPGIIPTVRWSWQPLTVAGGALVWQLDGWNWLAALLVLLVTATGLAAQADPAGDPAGRDRASRSLWLAAAALAFVFSDNVVTLAISWICLDAMLLLRLLPGQAGEPAGRAWGLLSLGGLALLAALVFLGEGNVRVTLTAGPMPRGALALLWLAALIRTGAYPFHLWLTGPGHLDGSDRIALHLIGPTAGIWLVARVHQLGQPGWLHRPEWAALGAMALLGTALAAWASATRTGAWRWIAINRASLVVMTAFVAETAGPAALMWPMVTFSLGAALLALGETVRERWGWSRPAWLAALVVWGLPGTPGFLARSVLVLPAATTAPLAAALPLNVMIFGLVLIGEVLLVAALWEGVTGPVEAEPATRRQPAVWRLGAATVLIAVPIIAWGVVPRQPAMLAGLQAAGGLPQTLAQALGEARRSVWVGLAAAGLVGALLGWLRPMIFSGMRGWQEGITAVVSLEWLYQAVSVATQVAGSGLQFLARLGEGEGYLGWMALAALLLWVLLRM